MDLTDLSTMRSAVTVLSMFVFLGIIGWALRPPEPFRFRRSGATAVSR